MMNKLGPVIPDRWHFTIAILDLQDQPGSLSKINPCKGRLWEMK